MSKPIEKAKALAADMQAALKKHGASAFLTHVENDDSSVTMTIRITPPQGNGVKIDPVAFNEAIKK